jgi:hypothetical protein
MGAKGSSTLQILLENEAFKKGFHWLCKNGRRMEDVICSLGTVTSARELPQLAPITAGDLITIEDDNCDDEYLNEALKKRNGDIMPSELRSLPV